MNEDNKIGFGAFGTIYAITSKKDGKIYAVKKIETEKTGELEK